MTSPRATRPHPSAPTARPSRSRNTHGPAVPAAVGCRAAWLWQRRLQEPPGNGAKAPQRRRPEDRHLKTKDTNKKIDQDTHVSRPRRSIFFCVRPQNRNERSDCFDFQVLIRPRFPFSNIKRWPTMKQQAAPAPA